MVDAAGTLKQVRGGSPALSQLAAHVTHVAATSGAPPSATTMGQIPLMAPLSVVGHLPALLSQQFLAPNNLGTLAATSHHHNHHHHHHPGVAAAVVKPLVVVSLPSVVAQPATTPTSVGTAQ